VNKIWVIAGREYRAAVRTKSFIITLVLLPVLMAGSGAVQYVTKKQADTKDKHFAIMDLTPGEKIYPILKAAAEDRNRDVIDKETGQQVKPRYLLEAVHPTADTKGAIKEMRYELSQQVQKGKLWGFVEIGPDVIKPVPLGQSLEQRTTYLRYQTNHPTSQAFPTWLQTQLVVAILSVKSHLSPEIVEAQSKNQQVLTLRQEGLSEKDAQGNIVEPKTVNVIARFIVPGALVALMFTIVMLSSTPGMQGVIEEKMQRIAEVLLGSLPPFHLMLGKLLGLMGVSLTVAAVYLGGAFWAAQKYGFTEFLSAPVLTWYFLFQIMSVLMFGSLFLAIGAACTEIKETQTLVMPVMLIACVPMFLLGTAMEDPNNPLVVAASFFPPSTPMLMMARVAISPGPPLWQPLLGMVLVVLVTLGCVYAAGRIFRVGILMQGKGAKFSQLFQWVFRG
jgi:ABC-2 type transport system permease protein